METPRLLRLPDVIARTGLSRATIYLFMSRDDFPKSIKIGRRASAWVESEIDDWIESRIAASRGDK